MQEDSPERLSATLETLNARIARLAIGLGVDLSASDAMAMLMQLPNQSASALTIERQKAAADAAGTRVNSTGEQRDAHLHEELRGLITLRYHIETLSVTENGLSATRQMVIQAHQHLLDQGFSAGADGLTAQMMQDLEESPSEKKDHERRT